MYHIRSTRPYIDVIFEKTPEASNKSITLHKNWLGLDTLRQCIEYNYTFYNSSSSRGRGGIVVTTMALGLK